ncbi:MAG: DUF1097 domain-containing protein [Phycisphaerae bacterium]|jgi:hypothetical protein|nr:DUF1097 domain-containing protein [Phycisphaerae bacterium]
MTFKQFFPIPVGIAVLAFLLMIFDIIAGYCPGKYFVIWVAFQAWAMYFMAGCTLQNGVKVMLGYLGGAVASIAIMEFSGLISFLGPMAAPVAVLIIVVPVICAERVPMLDFVPAWFVGAGVYFALRGSYPTHTATTITSLFSCAVGIAFGIATVVGRGKYEATLKLGEEAPAEAPAEAVAETPAEAPAPAETEESAE